ncbi:MAG: hypothetical protein IKQ61_13750 [Spirochaetales bacterium]|nr:hypothetical protein [Spirochaetales bacterium]
MDKNDFSFSYTNAVEDISALNIYSFAVSPHFKRNIWNGRIFVLAYVLVAVLYAVFRMEQPFDRYLMIGSMVVVGILWYFLFPWFYRNSIKDEAFAKQRHGRLKLVPITVSVSDGLLDVATDGQSYQVVGDDILSVEVCTNKTYLILKEESRSLVIPHNAVPQDVQPVLTEFLTETFSDKVIHTGVQTK